MAVTSAAIDSTSLARYTAGKPFIVSYNLVKGASAVGWYSDNHSTLVTSSTYPTSRVYDDYLHLDSRPSSAGNTRYLMADISTAAEFDFSLLVFDRDSVRGSAAAYISLGGYPSVGGIAVTLDQHDAARVVDDFAASGQRGRTCWEGILTDAAAGTTPEVFTGCAVVTAFFNAGASKTMQVYEWWLGKRWFLPYHPTMPFDDWSSAPQTETFTSDSGVETVYRRHSPAAEFDFSIPLVTTADRQAWQAVAKNTRGFSDPFLLGFPSSGGYRVGLESPAVYVVRAEPRVSLPTVGPYEREMRLRCHEIGGSFLWDESYSSPPYTS